MKKIKAVLKMRFLEQLRDCYEDGPIFNICYFDGVPTTALSYVREVVGTTLFPNSIEESIVGGYDYMVLRVRDMDVDIELKPGDHVVMFADNTFVTFRNFDKVEVVDGKLLLS